MRPLYRIAQDIKNDWAKVNYAAKPYLDAMSALNNVGENYYHDTGKSIVGRFLANAGAWRGDTAKRIKKELKEML